MSLDYIKELGIDSTKPTETDGEVNNQENFVQDSTTEESKEAMKDTAPDISMELKKQIEGLEKRISDKDEYINLLREQSKTQEEAKSVEKEVDRAGSIIFIIRFRRVGFLNIFLNFSGNFSPDIE